MNCMNTMVLLMQIVSSSSWVPEPVRFRKQLTTWMRAAKKPVCCRFVSSDHLHWKILFKPFLQLWSRLLCWIVAKNPIALVSLCTWMWWMLLTKHGTAHTQESLVVDTVYRLKNLHQAWWWLCTKNSAKHNPRITLPLVLMMMLHIPVLLTISSSHWNHNTCSVDYSLVWAQMVPWAPTKTLSKSLVIKPMTMCKDTLYMTPRNLVH